jgi:hypothetical protein
MKYLVILILLAGGGYAGYRYLGPQAEADPAAAAAGADSATGAEGSSTQAAGVAGVVETAPPSAFAGIDTGGGAAATTVAATTAPAASGELPAAIAALKSQTDAKWAELTAAGTDPTTNQQAPALALAYSQVLKATYGRDDLNGLAQQLIDERLAPLAAKLFFSPTPYLKDSTGLFELVPIDDKLDNIGRKYGMSYQFINIMRGSDAEDGLYHAGDQIKVVNVKEKGYFMHIDKAEFHMDVFVGDVFIRRYPIGHGAPETPTPAGTTEIRAREKYPQWTDPKTKRVFQYGEDGHILGPVWLAFTNSLGRSGLGIHGYTGADGNATEVLASNGCIRMDNDQALELYNIVVPCGVFSGKFITRAPMKVTVID